jgi:hypothetical protein
MMAMLLLVPGVHAASQEASPAAMDSRLASSGLPELRIVVTDEGSDVPQEVPAGWLLVVLENRGTPEGPAAVTDVNILQLPEGVTLDVLNAVFTSGTGELPDWFNDLVSVGGINVPAGQTGYAVLDLGPGEWYVGVGEGNPYVALSVTPGVDASPASSSDLPADVMIGLSEFAFDVPDQFPSGTQVWHATNTGEQLHEMQLVRTPELLTV